MKSLLLLFIALGTLITPLTSMTQGRASAAIASNWQAGRIIDDSIFTNNSSMTVAQIQDFLNQKVGTGGNGRIAGQCDTNGVATSELGGGTRAQYGASHGNPAPFTCLKDYYEVPKTSPGPEVPASNYGGAPIPAGAKSAAHLIWDAAQKYSISPKVLLVTIHKESAGPLITDDWPFQSQYKYAMGAHCPDSGPNNSANCDPNYSGFSIQISESAALMRYYLDNMSQPWWPYKKPGVNSILYNPSTSCGSANVSIVSKATAALYTYTPYQPNAAALNNLYGTGDSCSAYGNRNFWRMYTDWFGITTGTNVVRSATNPTYYLLSNNMKFGIPNGDILYAYGLERTELTYVSDQYLASVPDGGLLSTIFTVPGSGTVYLADTNRRFGIPSGAVCTNWGLACGTSVQKELGPEIVNTMIHGGTLTSLMSTRGAIYQMSDGKKLPFFSEKALTDRGYGFGDAVAIHNFSNVLQPLGIALLENNSFVKFGSSNGIFLHSNDKFYGVPDLDVLKSWSSPKIRFFSDNASSYNQNLPSSTFNLSSLVDFGDGTTYILDSGAKINTGAYKAAFPVPLNASNLSSANTLFETKTTVTERSTFRLRNGAIFRVESQKKLPFNSVSDYFLLGFDSSNIIQLNSNNLSDYSQGQTLLAEGRLLKLPGDETIYATGPLGSLYSLSSLAQLGQFKFDTSSVPRADTATAAAYPTNQALRSLIKVGANYSVISKGEKLVIPSSLESAYNVNSLSSSIFNQQAFKNITTTKSLNRFIQDAGGTIFYVENGIKRPITSYSMFKQLGGTSSNTFEVPADFLNSIPNGTSI